MMKAKYGDNWDGTNLSGFSGLPGGYRDFNGYFYYAGNDGLWWSSSPDGSSAWVRFLYFNYEVVDRSFNDRRSGFSVRCVRDAE